MLIRLITGGGLLALGYYLGKAVGRMDVMREELKQAQPHDAGGTVEDAASPTSNDRPEETPT